MTDVLIIEDDAWWAEQFTRVLQRADISTATTTNGVHAMEMIDESPPRVIVLDMLLAGGAGLTLLHELQSYHDTAALPVIVCTNLAAQLQLEDLKPYGVCRILDKLTMHPDDVVTAVRAVLL